MSGFLLEDGSGVILLEDGSRLLLEDVEPTAIAGVEAFGAPSVTLMPPPQTMGPSSIASAEVVNSGISFSDDFNRTDGALGNNWIGTNNAATVAGNQLVGGSGTSIQYFVGDPGSGKQFAQMTYRGAASVGVAVAVTPFGPATSKINTGTYYVFRQGAVSAASQIVQKDLGATTFTILANGGPTLVVGDVIRLEYDGTTLTGFINGTQVLTHTPASPITGQNRLGIDHNQGTGQGVALADDFLGGVVGGPVVAQTSAAINVQPTAIASSQAFGTSSVSTAINLSPGGISSAQAFGTPAVTRPQTVSPVAILDDHHPYLPSVPTILPKVIGATAEFGMWEDVLSGAGTVGLNARRHYPIFVASGKNKSADIEDSIANGRMPVISYKPPNAAGQTVPDTAGFLAGTYDAMLTATVNYLISLNFPMTVSFWHEPHNEITPADFVTACHKFQDAFEAAGASSLISHGPILNGFLLDSVADRVKFEAFIPESLLARWDFVAADSYQNGTNEAPGVKLPSRVAPALVDMLTLHGYPDMPIGVGEYNGLTPATIADAGETFLSTPTLWFALLWIGVANSNGIDWTMDTAEWAAYKATKEDTRALGSNVAGIAIATAPLGVGSGQAFGNPSASVQAPVGPTGIVSAQAFGSPSITSSIILSPTAITSAQAFGTSTHTGVLAASPTAITSAQAFGTLTATKFLTTTPKAILDDHNPFIVGESPILPKVIGGTTSVAAYDDFVNTVGKTSLKARRVYAFIEANGLDKAPIIEDTIARGMLPVISYKVTDLATFLAGGYDAWMVTTRDYLLSLNHPMTITFHHEPYGNMTAAEFRAGSQKFLDIFQSPLFSHGPILNGWLLDTPGNTVLFKEFLSTELLNQWDFVALDSYQDGSHLAPGNKVPGRPIPWLVDILTDMGYPDMPVGVGEYNGFSASMLASAAEIFLSTPQLWFACVWLGTAASDGTIYDLAGDKLAAFQATKADSRALGDTIVGLPVTSTPSGVGSQQAFGTPSTSAVVSSTPVTIVSSEVVGSPSITNRVSLTPFAISSVEASGTPSINTVLRLSPVAVSSAQVFGTPIVNTSITMTTIGVATAEAIGNHSTLGLNFAGANGIASAQAFGSPSVSSLVNLSPVSVSSVEAFGIPNITRILTSSPVSIGSAEGVGTPSTFSFVNSTPNAIGSAEAVGSPSTAAQLSVTPTAIASIESLGNPTITTRVTVSGTMIASAEALGTPRAMTPGAVQNLSPVTITSAEAIGSSFAFWNQTMAPTGVVSQEASSNPVLFAKITMSPNGVISAENFNTPYANVQQNLLPTGIFSAEQLGSPFISKLFTMVPAPVMTLEAFGLPLVIVDEPPLSDIVITASIAERSKVATLASRNKQATLLGNWEV